MCVSMQSSCRIGPAHVSTSGPTLLFTLSSTNIRREDNSFGPDHPRGYFISTRAYLRFSSKMDTLSGSFNADRRCTDVTRAVAHYCHLAALWFTRPFSKLAMSKSSVLKKSRGKRYPPTSSWLVLCPWPSKFVALTVSR